MPCQEWLRRRLLPASRGKDLRHSNQCHQSLPTYRKRLLAEGYEIPAHGSDHVQTVRDDAKTRPPYAPSHLRGLLDLQWSPIGITQLPEWKCYTRSW